MCNEIGRPISNVSITWHPLFLVPFIPTVQNRSFSTFTLRNSDEMEIDDLPKLCAALYGGSEHCDWRKVGAAKKIYSELFNACVDRGGTIDFRTFRSIVIYHGTFMFPVFDVQRVIRQKVRGHTADKGWTGRRAVDMTWT